MIFTRKQTRLMGEKPVTEVMADHGISRGLMKDFHAITTLTLYDKGDLVVNPKASVHRVMTRFSDTLYRGRGCHG